MRQDETQFDDPELKAMLKRALGSEVAPAGLRQRITKAIEARERQQQAVRLRWQKPVFRIAAAAVLLLGLGLAYTLIFSKERAAPQWFAAAMVKTHDESPADAVLPAGVSA